MLGAMIYDVKKAWFDSFQQVALSVGSTYMNELKQEF